MDKVFPGVYMGAGGGQPGVWAISDSTTPARRLTAFPPGNSVYALGVDGQTGRIAAGTRAGRIEVLPPSPGESGLGGSCELSLVQGAPVLCVCFADESRLLAADTAGRCLVWDLLDAARPPRVLDAGDGVCSLLGVGEEMLVGLSVTGKLIFWGLPDLKVSRIHDCPKPPRSHALVALVHWPAQEAIAFPAADGGLVLCGLDGGEPHACGAHRGEFYAVMEGGECLYTVGRQDRCLRVWGGPEGSPMEECAAPAGVIAGHALWDGSGRLVLVTEDGHAGIYAHEARGLSLERRLEGGDYRIASGSRPEDRLAFEAARRHARACELQAQIQAAMASRQAADIEPLHRELVALGYQAASLGMRAQSAAQQDDLLAELRSRHQLAALLPPHDPRAAESLRRYVSVLERVWRPAEARRAAAQGSFQESEEAQSARERMAALLGGQDCVTEPDVPVPVLIQAADLLQKPFLGLWLLEVADSIPLPGSDADAEAIALKYSQERETDGREGLPLAHARAMTWLSRSGAREVETILFDTPARGGHPVLRLALQVDRDGLQTVLVPAVLFDAGAGLTEPHATIHNHRLLQALENRDCRERFDSWCRAVLAVLSRSLRRLRTHGLAQRPA